MSNNKILEDLLLKWEAAKEEQYPYRQQWLEYYKYYKRYTVVTGTYEDKKLLPIAFSVINAIAPKIYENRQRIQYIMRRTPEQLNIQGHQQYVELMSAIMNYITEYQLKISNYDVIIEKVLLNGLIYGTGCLFLGWGENDKTNHLEFRSLLPFQLFPSPEMGGIEDLNKRGSYIFWRLYCTVEEVKGMFEDGVYNIPLPKDVKVEDFYTENLDRSDMSGVLDNDTPGCNRGRNEAIEVLHYFDKDNCYVILGGVYLVKKGELPYGIKSIPLFFFPNHIATDKFWGDSEIEHIKEYIFDKTKVRMLIENNLELMVNNMFLVPDTGSVYISDLINAPGQYIRYDTQMGVDSIKILPKQNIGQEPYLQNNIYDKEVMETIGINEYSYPTRRQHVETATAVQELTDTSSARFSVKLIHLATYVQAPMASYLIELNKRKLNTMRFPTSTDKFGEFNNVSIDKKLLKHLQTDFDVMGLPGNPRVTNQQEFNNMLKTILSLPNILELISLEDLVREAFNIFNIPTSSFLKKNSSKSISGLSGQIVGANQQLQNVNMQDLEQLKHMASQGDREAINILNMLGGEQNRQ